MVLGKLPVLGRPTKLDDSRARTYCAYSRYGWALFGIFSLVYRLKQGCSLSPILFNLYVNDLVTQISELGLGIDIDGEKVAVLLYADDLVILSETEDDLQAILDTLHVWCSTNCLFVNPEKSKIIHFRPRLRHKLIKYFI